MKKASKTNIVETHRNSFDHMRPKYNSNWEWDKKIEFVLDIINYADSNELMDAIRYLEKDNKPSVKYIKEGVENGFNILSDKNKIEYFSMKPTKKTISPLSTRKHSLEFAKQNFTKDYVQSALEQTTELVVAAEILNVTTNDLKTLISLHNIKYISSKQKKAVNKDNINMNEFMKYYAISTTRNFLAAKLNTSVQTIRKVKAKYDLA